MSTETSSPEVNICPNCSSEVSNLYCATCGKKYQPGRITFKKMIGSWYCGRKEDIEIFLVTTRDLLLRPSKVIRGYWEGKTEIYFIFFTFSFALIGLIVGLSAALLGLI